MPGDLVSLFDTSVTRPPVRPYDRTHEATGGSHEAAGSRPVPRRRHALSHRLSGAVGHRPTPASTGPLEAIPTTRGHRAHPHTLPHACRNCPGGNSMSRSDVL